MAAASVRQQQAEAKTDATFSASYERPNSGFSFSAFDPAGNLQPIVRPLKLCRVWYALDPACSIATRGAIAAARADVSAARNQVTAANLNAPSRRYAKPCSVPSGTGTRDCLSKGSPRSSRENLDVVRQTYGYGRIPLLEVIANNAASLISRPDIPTFCSTLMCHASRLNAPWARTCPEGGIVCKP